MTKRFFSIYSHNNAALNRFADNLSYVKTTNICFPTFCHSLFLAQISL